MQTTKKIHKKDIKIGMYVCGLERLGECMTLPLQGFLIEHDYQIHKLQQVCEYVEIDESRSINALTLDSTASTEEAEQIEMTSVTEAFQADHDPFLLEASSLPDNAIHCSSAELDFFKAFGVTETIKPNVTLFDEGQKPNRLFWQHNKMYLLVEGEVDIVVDGNYVNTVKTGEIFGELTPLILAKRSATVVTKTACELISLNEAQFVRGLEKQPEFALMLMNVLIQRIRQAVEDAKSLGLPVENKVSKSIPVFNSKMMRELVQTMDHSAVTNILAPQTIFRKGAIGMLMYVVLEGQVITHLDDKIVERSGPGCVIGEMALVDQQRRLARVVAETDCSLLAINRQAFLDLVKTQPAFSTSLLQALASRLRFWRTGETFQSDQ